MINYGHLGLEDTAYAGSITSVALAAGAVAGSVLLSKGGRANHLKDTLSIIRSSVAQDDIYPRWVRMMRQEALSLLIMWLCIVAMPAAMLASSQGGELRQLLAWCHMASWIISSGVLMCLSYGFALIWRSLAVMIDAFCCTVFDRRDFLGGVDEWSMLQAVLRKASIATELSGLSLHVMAGLSVPMLVYDFVVVVKTRSGLLALISDTLVVLCILRTFLLAGAITEKCTRVPALISSMHLDLGHRGIERQRFRLIEHIHSSGAGIYIFNRRLDTALTLKFVYVWIVIIFGITTQVLSRSTSAD